MPPKKDLKKDLSSRLADAGEDAISRLHDAPGADRLIRVANSMRDRVDELQKKVRGIDDLENRIAALERKVEELSGTERRAPARRTTSKTTTGTRKPPAASTGSTERAGGQSPG
jgi:hypothetical protein